MNRVRFVKRLRLVVYAVAAILVATLVMRYDALRIPRTGCSPLAQFQPGTRLLLDNWRTPSEGDAVLFRAGADLLLGRIAAVPEGLPDELPSTWAAFDAEHHWIVADAPDCPAEDSRSLGPIAHDDIVAVVAAGLPW